MTGAIIQARMSSTRLPGKVMLDILDKPMLWHVVKRVSAARTIKEIIIATSNNPNDNVIEEFCKKSGFKVFRGSENDCLDRFYQAAIFFGLKSIVRITADCPLICPEVINKIVGVYLNGNYDYVTNRIKYTYPDGGDVEVFSFDALRKAYRQTKLPSDREHVTSYFRNSGRFKIKNVESENPGLLRRYRWSVDEQKDLEFVRKVYEYLYRKKKIFSMDDILRLLQRKPELISINQNIITNVGYFKSFLNNPAVMPKRLSFKKSLSLKKRAKELIPSCSQTFSKSPSQFVQGASPVFLEKAKGSHVWDVDGNEYIDYAMALGPIILGYNYTSINKEIEKYLKLGTTFTLPHQAEIELAQLLCRIIPCAQMARFGKNGSDVTSGAVRIARAYTGRDKIACCGYHGWQDWYIATTSRNKGIPEVVRNLTLTFRYNDIKSLERLFKENPKEIACVIMEPVGIVEPKSGFLEKVKELTHKNGALLIFDEVVSGFRFALGGAQEYFGIIPDLACFGKAMGNGMPIAAIIGRKKIMKMFDEVFFSFTFGGEILSIAAALATINELKEKDVISYLWEQGKKLKDGFNVLSKEYGIDRFIRCEGLPPRTVVLFKNNNGKDWKELKSLFQQECIKRSILFTGSHNICFSHTDKDIDYTLNVYRTVLEIVADAIKKNKVKKLLKGGPVQPVFREP